MNRATLVFLIGLTFLTFGCSSEKSNDGGEGVSEDVSVDGEFVYETEKVADLAILRYQGPGFDKLDLKKKKLVYYMSQAALSGRDMVYDQNCKYNLQVRRTLETIVDEYKGNRQTEEFGKFMEYTKRVWFSNGIHHHYSTLKILPDFSKEYFNELVFSVSNSKMLPREKSVPMETFVYNITNIIFNPEVASKRVNKNPDVDMIMASSNNFYEGVTKAEADSFYSAMLVRGNENPISYGLNSKLIKNEAGELEEKTWKLNGMYHAAIEKVIFWLRKASEVAENDQQKRTIDLLVNYYESGDLKVFDEYNIAWVNDTASEVDMINGFTEVYGDPIGLKGSYESIVAFKDAQATKRIAAISKYAQWFEDNSPLQENHKKESVKGISAKVITVAMEAGDASPSTPIGINLPNSSWIRKDHGSKSVNLGNIVNAYNEAGKSSGQLEEFAYDEEEIFLAKKWGTLADNLHTDMHEVIGHASGQLEPGVATAKITLKNYASTLEEARADLVALYYLMDKKLIEIGVMETLDVGKVAYNDYIANGMMLQLKRLNPGEEIEEDHMRNRQLIAGWAYEMGKADSVIQRVTRDDKTYFIVKDYDKLREIFGLQLREIQRIKSLGDFEAGKKLVETYGVKVDEELHAEVLERFGKLNNAAYQGFIQPKLVPVMEGEEIIDVKVEYPDDFAEQMMYFAKNFSFLPTKN